MSNDKLEQLRTLVWLGGIHLNPDVKPPDYSHEPLADARLAIQFRQRSLVQKKLGELNSSPDKWLRQAAEQAKKPEFNE